MIISFYAALAARWLGEQFNNSHQRLMSSLLFVAMEKLSCAFVTESDRLTKSSSGIDSNTTTIIIISSPYNGTNSQQTVIAGELLQPGQ